MEGQGLGKTVFRREDFGTLVRRDDEEEEKNAISRRKANYYYKMRQKWKNDRENDYLKKKLNDEATAPEERDVIRSAMGSYQEIEDEDELLLKRKFIPRGTYVPMNPCLYEETRLRLEREEEDRINTIREGKDRRELLLANALKKEEEDGEDIPIDVDAVISLQRTIKEVAEAVEEFGIRGQEVLNDDLKRLRFVMSEMTGVRVLLKFDENAFLRKVKDGFEEKESWKALMRLVYVEKRCFGLYGTLSKVKERQYRTWVTKLIHDFVTDDN